MVAMLGKVVLEISNFELLTVKNCMSGNETCCQRQFRGSCESYGHDQMIKYSNSRKFSDAMNRLKQLQLHGLGSHHVGPNGC